MLLEYEWANPATAAAALLLFGEETSQENSQNRLNMFDHYEPQLQPILGMNFFPDPNPVGLYSGSSQQRFGLGVQPDGPAMIGLNLGVRTYFSPEEEMVVGRVSRRRTKTVRCQAEGCGADLSSAKHYHRRHKVCEFHSKASTVMAAGMSQRFCQQCSRFHVLTEFDQGKRSCRKRLADHNRRRRKSQDLLTSSSIINSGSKNEYNNQKENDNENTRLSCPDKPLIMMKNTETSLSAAYVSSPPPPFESIAIPPMALGLGCTSALSASSSTSSPPQSISFLSHLGEFPGHENRFASWDEAEDGSSISIRGIFQSK